MNRWSWTRPAHVRRWTGWLATGLAVLVLSSCGDDESPADPADETGTTKGPGSGSNPEAGTETDTPDAAGDASTSDESQAPEPPPGGWQLVQRRDTGVDFVHQRFTTPERKYLPETAGSGLAMLDADVDGDLDLYFIQCRTLPGHPDFPKTERNRLYRNDGDWKFTDVTDTAKVGDEGYGMGATAPDLDNDGDPDLFVTNVGDNVLYRNQGDGTFENVTEGSGLVDPMWSTAAGWADLDRDGDLDCYLANYAVCDFENYKVCQSKVQGVTLYSYCHPDTLVAEPDHLYRNDGGFQFTDITDDAGIEDTIGKGLAVVPMDHDNDGWVDLFVANDSNENFLWLNNKDMTFEEVADFLGVSVSSRGASQGCMGTDVGDVDGDLDFDIVSVNFGKEANVLYMRVDEDFYEDLVNKAGLGDTSYLFTGFGAELFDYDRDADLDFMVVNGHIVDIVEQVDPSQTFLQVAHLYVNDGSGKYREIGTTVGDYFHVPHLGRGMAVGDLDQDGDLDVVINNNDHAAALLENRAGADRHWVGLALTGTRSPRDAIGARVTLKAGDRTQVEEVRGSSSYLSWVDLRLFFGLGDHDGPVDVTIRWPSGAEQSVTGLEADRYHAITEPE